MSKCENEIEALESDYLYVKNSQIRGAGNGLFTAIDIYKNETVAIFLGEILSDAEATVRATQGNDLYFISLLDGRIMDSMRTDCLAKYANDASATSQTEFKNNMQITFNDQNQVCLTATRAIHANEELFCAYGSRYWKKHSVKW
jgi:hypothetical protein